MDSIKAGRSPDGDSCSDEDENLALSRAEQDQQAVPCRQSECIPIAHSLRPKVSPSPARLGGMCTGGSVQNKARVEGCHAEEQKAEELAWLVRDNLHAKHLVLSVEELFVEFLECPLSEEGTLALEPMESYQRMLLHRLADLFGLAHESIGEGEERHLVVEKCEDSSIPAVLVSDVLLNDDRDTELPQVSKQLLKRNTTQTDGSQTPPSSSSMVSLEERQTAYLAARQRIFSATWKYAEESSKSTEVVRPRSDPVVARRMIAHALGRNKVLAFTSPAAGLTSPEDVPLESFGRGVSPTIGGDSPGNEEPSISIELKESMQQSSAIAAKRIFANALSSSHARYLPGLNLRPISCKTGTGIVPSDHGEGTTVDSIVPSSRNLTAIPRDSGGNADQGRSHSSEKSSSMRPRRGTRDARPGACRIFAQALGASQMESTDASRPTSHYQRS